MAGNGRHLITTADERTWTADRPVLFLGEWCRSYSRRHVWSCMDSVVAAPYGRGQAVRDRDHVRVRRVEEELSAVLGRELDAVHGTTHSRRFWSILLGHWLRRYVEVVYNRFHTLRQCLESYDVSSTTALVGDDYHLATVTSLDFIWACNDAVWNNVLGARVLGYVAAGSVPMESVPLSAGPGFRLTESSTDDPVRSPLRERLLDAMDGVTDLFVTARDAFIINSYLPRLQEAKAQLRLGQVPKIWRTPSVSLPHTPDRALRRELARRLSGRSTDDFGRCADDLLFELLPICYLEGFAALRTRTGELPWPQRPQHIFTSNNFDTDEVFKCWAATKVESGVPLYTGQHGNNYGTHRYMNPSVEEQVSDRFLTWGWIDGLPQHTAAFVFKTAGMKGPACRPSGGLLLVAANMSHRTTTWDGHADFADYFEDQQKFISNLAAGCRDAVTLRLHSAHQRMGWDEQARWRDYDASLRVDAGARPIRAAMEDSRLVVHSYDSTGILECLAQNIPMLAFWRNGFEHLRESAWPWYQLLLDAGVIHLSAESAARKVSEIWEDVPGWWHGNEVQQARRRFCRRYAVSSAHPARDFVRLVQERDVQHDLQGSRTAQ